MAAAEALGLEADDAALSATSSALALSLGGAQAARAAAFSEPGGGLAATPVTATFQVLYMIGWSPAESQQVPDKRGSATRNLSEIAITSSSPSASAGAVASSSSSAEAEEEGEEGDEPASLEK